MAVAMHTLVLQVGQHLGTEARVGPDSGEGGVDADQPLGRRAPR